jgi:predicted ATPase with chaperone activity
VVLKEATLQDILANAETGADLGIPLVIVNDLLLRLLYNEAQVSLSRAAEMIRVHARLLDTLLEQMQFEHLVEVSSAGQMGRMSYTYQLSDAGRIRAKEAFERSHYVGPAPVSLERYDLAIRLQTEAVATVRPEAVRLALADLVLPDDFHRRIGLAINAGHSLFLYGPPGNGKTATAECIARLLGGENPIWLPYAVTVAGQIITIYDPLIHQPMSAPRERTAPLSTDRRWGLFRRPWVIAGGELTLESLELRFDPVTKFYEAPLQMKANGGMLLIDDFGRQQVSPAALLNRWIVPLESQVDYLRLRTGQTMAVPFRQFLVFSTNLDPKELVDDAFLRRIQVKVGVGRPDERMFYTIFTRMCEQLNVPFDRDAFVHLVNRWYRSGAQKMQAVHARDLISLVIAICDYEGQPRHLTPELIDEACDNYFVKDASIL